MIAEYIRQFDIEVEIIDIGLDLRNALIVTQERQRGGECCLFFVFLYQIDCQLSRHVQVLLYIFVLNLLLFKLKEQQICRLFWHH